MTGNRKLLLMIVALSVYLLYPIVQERIGASPWRYIGSDPAPGEVVTRPPTTVTVRLSDPVSPWSTLEVHAATLGPWAGYVGEHYSWEEVTGEGGVDERDPEGKSLTATVRPHTGARVYRAEWTAQARDGRGKRYGTLYFGVGAPLPEELMEAVGGPFRERNVRPMRSRDPRGAAALLLLVLIASAVHNALGGRRSVEWGPRTPRA